MGSVENGKSNRKEEEVREKEKKNFEEAEMDIWCFKELDAVELNAGCGYTKGFVKGCSYKGGGEYSDEGHGFTLAWRRMVGDPKCLQQSWKKLVRKRKKMRENT